MGGPWCLHRRGPHTSEGVAVAVANDPAVCVHLHGSGRGGPFAVFDPSTERRPGSPEHGSLRPFVQVATDGCEVELHTVGELPPGEDARIRVCRAGHLPGHQSFRIGLAGHRISEQQQVGLGLELQDGLGDVAADGDRIGDVAQSSGAVLHVVGNAEQRRGARSPAVDEEAVEGPPLRLHRVDERHQVVGGLGLACGDHPLGAVAGGQPAAAGGVTDRGEHVEGERVARMAQRSIAGGVALLERRHRRCITHVEQRLAAVADAHLLHGRTDPHLATVEHHGVQQAEAGVAVDSGRHVQPLDRNRAVEARPVRRSPHEHPGREPGGVAGPGVPVAVRGSVERDMARGRAGDEVLLLHVAVAFRHRSRQLVGGYSLDRTLDRNPGRPMCGHCWITTIRSSVISRAAHAGPSLVLPESRMPP